MATDGEPCPSRRRSRAAGRRLARTRPGEEIALAGIAGRFPCSDDMEEFGRNLFGKVDMVTSTGNRWDLVHPDLPARSGKVNGIEKFDAGHFGVHRREADIMEPMYRCLMERVVEAVLDAGFHPSELEGTRTGVYVGSINTDYQRQLMRHDLPPKNHALTAICRFVLPNRISYALKVNGPSYVVDTACSSSIYALDRAYRDLRNGEVDSAIVAVTVLNLHPVSTLQFAKLGVLSPDGASKTFDDTADGYARAETVSAVFLRRKRDARRVYATVVHCKANCDGYKDEGITFPSAEQQKTLLAEFYEECEVDPATVEYVEAHGTGTRVGDFEEIRPIDEVFCAGRAACLPVGSVKSNMGHSEPGAGLCQIAKAVIAMESGSVPPNLHFHRPRDGVDAFASGRIKIVTETTPLEGRTGLIAISSFGFGGSNGHTLLRWNENGTKNDYDGAPILVCASGRTGAAVRRLLDGVTGDRELAALLHAAFRHDTPSHGYRGFAVVEPSARKKETSVAKCAGASEPFLFFGGDVDATALLEVAEELSRFPMFGDFLRRFEQMLPRSDTRIFYKGWQKSTETQVAATVAVQVAVLRVLRELNVLPDKVRGRSYGKLVECYAEGTLELEETAKACVRVADGLSDRGGGWKLREALVAMLTRNGNTGFDRPTSERVELIAADLETTPDRNDRVIVAFRNEDDFSLDVQLPTRGESAAVTFLKIIGRLYENGCPPPRLDRLYPEVKFPVSRGTPMISPLIGWNHDEDWFVVSYRNDGIRSRRFERRIVVNAKESDWSYVTGHVIDGRNLFPATGYLFLVWETLASLNGKLSADTKVSFDGVRFNRATTISRDGSVEFLVSIHKGNGLFEVVEGETSVVGGTVRIEDDVLKEHYNMNIEQVVKDDEIWPRETDVYKELRLRGYQYSGLFRGIEECDPGYRRASVRWCGNWVAFMDNMLQLQLLDVPTRDLFVPTYVQRLTIDAGYHLQYAAAKRKRHGDDRNNCILPVYHYREFNCVKSGGIEIRGMNASGIAKRRTTTDPMLEKYVFVPNETRLDLKESVRVNVQIVLENNYTVKVKFAEVEDEDPLTPVILEALAQQPSVRGEATTLPVDKKPKGGLGDCLLVVGRDLLDNRTLLEQVEKSLPDESFILSRQGGPVRRTVPSFQIVTVHQTPLGSLVLMKKEKNAPNTAVTTVEVQDDTGWIAPLQAALGRGESVLVYCRNLSDNGVLGFVNCLRKEAGGENCRCVLISDENAPPFDREAALYRDQLRKGIAVNVYVNGEWGTYRHLSITNETTSDAKGRRSVLDCLTKGDLSSLRWIEGPPLTNTVTKLDLGKELVRVHYAALNFKDVMIASGRIQTSLEEKLSSLGIEYSGTDSRGNRVMGVVCSGGMSTLVSADKALMFPVPQAWSLEEAATVPVVYMTVLYGLIERASIKRGESILIHAGTGGIGQAAINVAHYHGLTVYTTVGTPEKKQFLLSRCPFVESHRVGNSRDTSFETMIMRETNGRGVDLVLNSLVEEKLQASVRCLARGGRFVEIGKFDSMNESPLHLEVFRKEAAVLGVHLDRIFEASPNAKYRLRLLLEEAMRTGSCLPLTRTTFDSDRTEEAFRFMAGGGHVGKVILRIGDGAKPSTTIPRHYCDPDGCHVVIGGLGGFGLELIDWLVKRGARKVVISSRNGLRTGYQASRIRNWRNEGVLVRISTDRDVTTAEGCRNLLEEASSFGAVVSIFNLAVVLSDALFENQSVDNFRRCLGPKADAIRHLDVLSRELCPCLRHFVAFSSVSCGRGNAGQTNYGFANSVMERVCEKRRREGLPGLAIQWGAVGDVGLVAEMQTEDVLLDIGGTLQQRITSCLEVMDALMTQDRYPVVGSMVVAEKRSASGKADNVVDAVAAIIGVRDIRTVSAHSTFPELGMDSMMATEIKQTMEREFEIFMTAKDVRNLTFARLHDIMSEKAAAAEIRTPEVSSDRNLDGAQGESDEGETKQEINNDILEAGAAFTTSSLVEIHRGPTRGGNRAIVIFFPGIEGFVTAPLRTLAERLTARSLCVQYCCDETRDAVTVQEIALKLVPAVDEAVGETAASGFTFLAYSYGCLIALETAAQLEKRGVTGRIVLVDGAPSATVRIAREQMGDERDQDALDMRIFEVVLSDYLTTEKVKLLMGELASVPSREAREEMFLKNLPTSEDKHVHHLQLLRTVKQRTNLLPSYVPSYPKIRSKILLCRPTEQSVSHEREDYGLSEVAEDVTVQYFRGNHCTILTREELVTAITRHMLLTANYA